jgi:hypothetical protein
MEEKNEKIHLLGWGERQKLVGHHWPAENLGVGGHCGGTEKTQLPFPNIVRH